MFTTNQVLLFLVMAACYQVTQQDERDEEIARQLVAANQNQSISQQQQAKKPETSCKGVVVLASTCCKNTHCCQGLFNGLTMLNCNNVNVTSDVNVFAGSGFITNLFCNTKSCNAGSECIKIIDIQKDVMKKVETRCCAAQDNGSFLCGNQVFCSQQTKVGKGGRKQVCCNGNCNKA